MRVAALLLLFCSPLAADESLIGGWNGDMLFDISTINQRANSLADEDQQFGEADIVIPEIASLDVAHVTHDKTGFASCHTACCGRPLLGLSGQLYLENMVEFGPSIGRTGDAAVFKGR